MQVSTKNATIVLFADVRLEHPPVAGAADLGVEGALDVAPRLVVGRPERDADLPPGEATRGKSP